MRFQQLLDGVEYLSQEGDAEVTGVNYDSRAVQTGHCFVAMKGETTQELSAARRLTDLILLNCSRQRVVFVEFV
jgi:UDP-N-acetylmuramyl tripeptide synthase